ncbi:conjugal transfer protein [Baia soyae]|uniref:Conjugative transposon protein TcpC n=1 Tax=Baia soyae TaxID=1544746 RepID=A0A4R2SAQ3_9BACL|nr:conjugal transfer protein [Baia soyae]TCP68295.1 conjugative transposon protein TcpC [Baia soyae]
MSQLAKRKFAIFGFWLLLIYTAVSTTAVWLIQFGIVPSSPRTVTAAKQEVQGDGLGDVLSETAFVDQFVREYFTWNQGNETIRASRLKPYLHSTVDPQAGIDMKNATYNSFPRSVGIWRIEDGEGGMKKVYVTVDTVLTHAKNESDQRRAIRYLAVTIQKSGESFLVVDKPYLMAPPVPAKIELPEMKSEPGEAVSDAERVQVENFLKTFWKVYTTGTANEIGYYEKEKNVISKGLTGLVGLSDVKNVAVTKKQGKLEVKCDVSFTDLPSGGQLSYQYSLSVVKEGDRFYVTNMKQGVR